MKRGLILAAVLGAATPLVAACGFTPLYATPGVSPSLAAIEVITPEGRTGQLISEQLQDQLALDRSQPAAYRLNLALDEKRYARGLKVEEVATWYELSLKVSYSLVDVSTGATLTSGFVPVNVSYDAVRDPYAGIVAQQDGQKRAAAEAALRIRLELSRFFASRGG
jgi:LPS-assembly lipoprotein